MTEILVRELAPALLKDWLAFFDYDAFADNHEWAACYCHFYHADHSARDWDERTSLENRTASSQLILAGRLKGYLAYIDRKPVGWCQAAPRRLVPNLQNDKRFAIPDADGVGSIACFAVAKPFRRSGVARRLLDAACAGFRDQGLAVAEGYPRKQASGDPANYHGPLALFLEAGFAPFSESEKVVVVRKNLGT